MEEKKLNFKFLEDSPVPDDYFKSHEKIADTILNIVKKQKGGKAISLWGQWGSGKSSVIEMLKKKVKDEKENISVFLFDSWEHEGDALKRSFVDKFIDFLIGKDWLKSKKERGVDKLLDDNLQRKWDLLHGKYKVDTIDTESKLTTLGQFLVLFLYLYPPAIAALSWIFSSDFTVFPFWGWISLGIISVPLVIGIFGIVFKKKEIFSLFTKSSVETKTVEKFETPEPTSIEFQSFFDEIVEKCLREDRKLVIAIDNLDRVKPDVALTLLSTMKPYIQCKEGKFENIWYLIPFDRDSLERIWERNDKSDQKGNRKKGYADSFLNKIFQIKLNVPQLVLSDWKGFFKDNIKEASSNYFSEEEIFDIRTIFEILFNSSKVKEGDTTKRLFPTPRNIKLFINNLMSSIILNSEINDYRVHAVSVGIREFREDLFRILPQKLEDERLLEELNLKRFLPEKWKNKMASLYFNIPEKKAMHALMATDIENAIINCDEKFFEGKKEVYGFEEIIDTVLSDSLYEWAKTKPHIVGLAANLFKDSERLTKKIYRFSRDIESFKDLSRNSAEGFAALISKYSHEESFVKKTLQKLSNIEQNIKIEEVKENG